MSRNCPENGKKFQFPGKRTWISAEWLFVKLHQLTPEGPLSFKTEIENIENKKSKRLRREMYEDINCDLCTKNPIQNASYNENTYTDICFLNILTVPVIRIVSLPWTVLEYFTDKMWKSTSFKCNLINIYRFFITINIYQHRLWYTLIL